MTKKDIEIPFRAIDNDEETNREFICKFLGTYDERKIAEVWNECVDHTNPTKYDKLYILDKHNLKLMLECLTEEQKDKVILSLCEDGFYNRFDYRELFFYVTQNCEIRTINSVWAHMDYDVLFAFFREYYPFTRYGVEWKKNHITTYCPTREHLVCKMDNGDAIFANYVDSYYVLVESDGTRYMREL